MRGRSSILGVGTLHGLALTLAGLLLVSAAACGSEDSGRREDTTDTSADTNGPDTSETVSPDTSEDTAETSGEEVDGGFRSPCLENSECDSGYCVNTELGPLCTRQCQDTCPDDWRCVCVGQTNQVGLSRAKFEEGAGRNLVAVRGATESRRRAVA